MSLQTLMFVVGVVFVVAGYPMYLYARMRHRTATAPAIRPTWLAGRPRREWFSTDHGYRLSVIARWMILLGGIISIVGSRM